MKKGSSVYLEIIGDETEENPDTLKRGCEKIKETGGFEFIIDDPKDIRFDTSIYLVAHGDDPTIVSEVRLGDKSPKQVADIVHRIFQATTLDNGGFKGKIILEGCHTSEPIIDSDSKKKHAEMVKLKDEGKHIFNSLIRSCKMAGKSFLAEFIECVKKEPKFSPEVIIGGYLGSGEEGDYHETGYGKAYSNNPLTVNFQERRGISGEKDNTGRKYSVSESFIETRVGQKLSFGAEKAKAGHRVV